MSLAYPKGALVGDYLRGGLGTGLTLPLALFVPMHPVMFWIFSGLAAIFLAYVLRTVFRQMTRYELSDRSLDRHGPRPAVLPWAELSEIRLRYFSTRRDRENGWMQLQLKGRTVTLVIESTLDGFEGLVETAAQHALASGLEVDDTTRSNLNAMGISLKRPGADDGEGDENGMADDRDWIGELKAARAARTASEPAPRKEGA